jgi:predicted RecB family endonuclease
MSGSEKQKPSLRLVDLALSYFKKEGFKVKGAAVSIEGDSAVVRQFDLVVQKGRDEQVVWIRDWNRTIGVNVIIGLDTASADVRMPNPIMIGEKFSDHAKSYSNRRKITLLTKQKLTTSFR